MQDLLDPPNTGHVSKRGVSRTSGDLGSPSASVEKRPTTGQAAGWPRRRRRRRLGLHDVRCMTTRVGGHLAVRGGPAGIPAGAPGSVIHCSQAPPRFLVDWVVLVWFLVSEVPPNTLRSDVCRRASGVVACRSQ